MTGVDAERVRRDVLRAVVPLLGEYESLSTARIAEAAGVTEDALLTVFAGKEAVVQACMTTLAEAMSAVLDPAGALRDLAAIPADQPLADRLVRVVDVFDAYYRGVRVDLDDLLARIGAPETPGGQRTDDLRGTGRSEEFRRAVAAVLEPDRAALRFPVDVLAAAFVGMVFDGLRPTPPGVPALPADQIVDLFLHGAGPDRLTGRVV